jgi:hypothetical protein
MSEHDSEDRPPHYAFPLVGQLEIKIQEYEEDRETYWTGRKDGMDWNSEAGVAAHADKVAGMLLDSVSQLARRVGPPETGEQFREERRAHLRELAQEIEQLQNRIPVGTESLELAPIIKKMLEESALEEPPSSEGSLLRLVFEKLVAHFALDMTARLVPAANRLLRLVGLVATAAPNRRTLEFLEGVSRCYVWGFDAEAVNQCRGAIDTAFEDKVTNAICEKHGFRPAKCGFMLAQRIQAAESEGIIDEKARKAAFRVNDHAKEAIHSSPKDAVAMTDVLKVIKDAVDVIQQLYPLESTASVSE